MRPVVFLGKKCARRKAEFIAHARPTKDGKGVVVLSNKAKKMLETKEKKFKKFIGVKIPI